MHLGQSSVPNVPKQRAAVKCVDVLGYNPMMAPENTQCWGKYHCTVGFQFYKFGLNCFENITFFSFLGKIQCC